MDVAVRAAHESQMDPLQCYSKSDEPGGGLKYVERERDEAVRRREDYWADLPDAGTLGGAWQGASENALTMCSKRLSSMPVEC